MSNYLYDGLKCEVKVKTDPNSKYRLLIFRDTDPIDPREDAGDLIDHMICWHKRYNLGDEHKYTSPTEFLQDMIRKYVPQEKLVDYVRKGTASLMLKYDCVTSMYNLYWTGIVGTSNTKERHHQNEFTEDEMKNGEAFESIIFCMDSLECHALLADSDVLIMPLYLYDHSGITMSTGRFADSYDSGQVGYIYADKETAIAEIRADVLDENGDCVMEKHTTKGGYEYTARKTIPLNDETWRDEVKKYLKLQVDVYDKYLTGSIYGYKLCMRTDDSPDDNPEYEEIDESTGYFCDTLEELADEIGVELVA